MSSRPNIIYMHSHDTGRYIQPYGYAVDTPHMQRLAEQGVLFRHAFCAAPTCSPSRAALTTGQWAHCTGMTGLAHRGWSLTDPKRHLTFTLREAGYHCVLSGVQHVTSHDPTQTLGYHEARRGDPAADACAFLDDAPRQPFFLAVGFGMTHRNGKRGGAYNDPPWQGDARYVRPPEPMPDTPETRRDHADFCVAAHRLDAAYGRILDALDRSGLAGNTLVICTTDHGPPSPLMKCNVFDAGIGVYLIMRGPGGFEGGRVIDPIVSHVDLFPTICDVAGIDAPSWLQGSSITPLVRGETERIRDELFAEVTYHAAYDPQRAVRTERYKYIRRYGDRSTPVLSNIDDSPSKSVMLDAGFADYHLPREALYDLALDPNERDNLVDAAPHAAIATDMRARLDRWMRDTNDPLLQGPVPPPRGAKVNRTDDASPQKPPVTVGRG